MALMLPIFRTIDPEGDVHKLSVFTKLRGVAVVAALGGILPGRGRATVDGVELTAWESVKVRGIPLLFLPVGEVARDHGRRYRVALEGFCTAKGRPYRKRSFWVRTAPRRERQSAYDQQDALALEAAREGMVLLQNEGGALPLAPEETLNCFGHAQHRWRGSASGASAINPRWRPGLHRAIREHSRFAVNEELAAFYRDPRASVPDAGMLARAREMSDAALVFIERASGEMIDNKPVKGEYYLADGELELLRAVRARFDRLIVILNTGYPVAMGWLREIRPEAVLYAGFAGMLSAYALAEILDGRTNPSGHLPDTWPWDWPDNPVSRNFPVPGPEAGYVHEDGTGVRIYYEEDVYLGYRYFDTFGVSVAFPFGHGLSYTSFAIEPVDLQRHDDGVTARVRVTNAGAVAGKAVAQLYVAPPKGHLERPARLLADFGKTEMLAPGEAQELTLTARFEDFAAFDEARGCYVLEAGEYALSVGESLEQRQPCGSLALEERIVQKVERLGAPVEGVDRLTRARPHVNGKKSGIVPLGEQIAVPAKRELDRYAPAKAAAKGEKLRWAEVLANPARLDAFVAGLSTLQLCRLVVCGGMRLAPWQDGASGFTHRLRSRGLPSFTVSDANAGLNLFRPNVGFPASSVIAATFSRQIAEGEGRALAEACREHGVDLLLGPGMNLHRSILCGRHPEYFSEDPLLAGVLAGCQGRGLEKAGVGSCYKHLFANHSELGRMGSHSVVSEQALRELYFRAFAIAFREQKPSAVMTSYNALNGLYPGENPALLRGLLRREWGFTGAVMSDWGSCKTVSAVGMLKAGNDWITPGGPLWVLRIWNAARRGEVSRAALEEDARDLLRGFGRLR